MSKTVNIKLRIEQDMHAQLQARAVAAERTVAAEIRLALRNYLADGHSDVAAPRRREDGVGA